MNIIIPMGGKGQRFLDAGYKENKPCILTTDRYTGQKIPMIICAIQDMPGAKDTNNKIICIDRDFHEENGTENVIKSYFPKVKFIHDHVLTGQATGAWLARELINTNEDLFLGACDNGMSYNEEAFKIAKENFDVLVISHTNDDNISKNPLAHSWLSLDENEDCVTGINIKKTVSDTPMRDHATTGMFWFKRGSDYIRFTEDMVSNKDTFKGEYYVDQVIQYAINDGLKVGFFDIDYICWGTPDDYEEYENTIDYWDKFLQKESF